LNLPDGDIFARAMTALRAGDLATAEIEFRKLLSEQPQHLAALNLLSIVLVQQTKYAEAEIYILRAIHLSSNSDTTFYNHGIILKHLGRPDEALDAFDKAIAINASVAETWNNRGAVLNQLNRYDEAVAAFEKAILLKPNYVEALSNQGKALYYLARYGEAERAYGKALALAPRMVEIWVGYATVLGDLNRLDESLAAYDKALALKPDIAEAWASKAKIFTVQNRHAEAVADFDRAVKIKPDIEFVSGDRILAKLMLCDWSDFESERANVIEGVREKKPVTFPFPFLALSGSSADQLECARIYAAKTVLVSHSAFRRRVTYSHDRVRIGYVSADFREHPVAHVMAGVFENHDKGRFDITAFSLAPPDRSQVRQRIEAACECFENLHGIPDLEIAAAIRKAEIDILVDLNGYTLGCRPNIFAMRPAPVQVNYLGYPGTVGSEFVDYIVADDIVIPESEERHYVERIVRLPHTYFPTDNTRKISDSEMTRSELGLPKEGFVFCSFNNTYKINPPVFGLWMCILSSVPGSVLWLGRMSPAVQEALQREAESRGIASERLVFGKFMPRPEDHLARYRLADLFLDTLPYNAHATASEALWAGLPLITCAGSTFASRVAASLLRAVGLRELVTHSLEEYERLAIKLATDGALLNAIRGKLAENRSSRPLFDTARFTRNLERAYIMMWQRAKTGVTPHAFRVEDIAES
jgi:protein O-GlcNAc transferase